MTFFKTFRSPWYGGTATPALPVGTVWDIAIAGRGYLIDRIQQGDARYRTESLPLAQRYYTFSQQADTNIGERTLNVEDYWRLSRESAHLGAGQTYFDRDHSDKARFRDSKGINPWEPGEITLLEDTWHKFTSANTNLFMASAGARLYFLDGNALKYVTDVSSGSGTSATTVTAGSDPLSSPTSITTDGFHVWVCDGTRINFTDTSASSFDAFHTSDEAASVVRFVKGRLLSVGTGSDKCTLRQSTMTFGNDSVASDLLTHPNPDWVWTDIAGGPAAIYFSGYSGQTSAIYKTAVVADGTALGVPSVALDLPIGEIAYSIYTYLGILCIGTSKGVRIAAMGDDGSLSIGDLIPLASQPLGFDAQDRYVWFGWSNYDATSTGLGRLDLRDFNGTTPAYASDLMATTTGAVQSVATFAGYRVFSVSGSGIWVEDTTTLVASGTMYGGWMNFGLAESKTFVKATVSYRTSAGTLTLALATDGDTTYDRLGAPITTTLGGEETLAANQKDGRDFELLLTLTRDGSDVLAAPVVSRITGMANPAPERRIKIVVPIRLFDHDTDRSDNAVQTDVMFERLVFEGLLQSNEITTFQEPGRSSLVTVDDLSWLPYDQPNGGNAENGTAVVTMKVAT